MNECQYYEKLVDGRCVAICPAFPPQVYNQESGACVACTTLYNSAKYTVVENQCVCSAGYEPDIGGECQMCQLDMIKPKTGNTACFPCESYETSDERRINCFNRCSRGGTALIYFYDEESLDCRACPQNMVVKANRCECAKGFYVDAGIAEIACVRAKTNASTGKQSRNAFIAITSVIVILHVFIGTWYCVYKHMKNKELRLRGIKSA